MSTNLCLRLRSDISQAREKVFPNLYHVALDVLAVSASGVPSERVFSSSKETDTLRRSGLDNAMFEVLQVLKFSMKRERLEFSEAWRPAQESELLEPGPSVTYSEASRLLSELRLDDFLRLVDESEHVTD